MFRLGIRPQSTSVPTALARGTAVALAVSAGLTLLVAAGPAGAEARASDAATSARQVTGISRATSSESTRQGHFSDPYPLQTPSSSRLAFSGTFEETITCTGRIRPGCFKPASLHVGLTTALRARISAHGLTVLATKAHHITRTAHGWQMVVTASVAPKGSGRSGRWNLIMHAHPRRQTAAAPRSWVVDSLLVGSLAHRTAATYDGKYVQDGGRLYLLYSRALSTSPTRFGIAALRMRTPAEPADTKPVTLLRPAPGRGLNSENYVGAAAGGGMRLVETGNVFKIHGVYVMSYSVGSYRRPAYKIGLAYSSTFLPAHGRTYRKVHLTDTDGVWGRAGANEVDYLLQSQKSRWPHYARSSVKAPGVGSLARQRGRWYLFFAGYDPAEKHDGENHTFTASHRQPYYLRVRVRIPKHARVAKASDRALRSWVRPL
ncbi:MAG: hypothetical protein QM638_22465 [Nocardioides sp.]|uniref:hypothetical protein n=1 Tax=Nocardioides sp. TaxID=35761 RepID=UPI0039E3E843